MIVGLSSEKLSLIEMSVLARWTIGPRLMSVPGVANVLSWFQQIAILVPFLLVLSGGLEIWRRRRQRESISSDAGRLVLAGGFLAVIDAARGVVEKRWPA